MPINKKIYRKSNIHMYTYSWRANFLIWKLRRRQKANWESAYDTSGKRELRRLGYSNSKCSEEERFFDFWDADEGASWLWTGSREADPNRYRTGGPTPKLISLWLRSYCSRVRTEIALIVIILDKVVLLRESCLYSLSIHYLTVDDWKFWKSSLHGEGWGEAAVRCGDENF